MTRLIRELRLIPVVLIAISCLFALKVVGLLVDGGYLFGGQAAKSENKNLAAAERALLEKIEPPEITGSVPAKPKEAPPPDPNAKPKPLEPQKDPGGKVITADPKPLSPAERALLERLQERREELETRARELDLRETLLKAAEKKLEGRLGEIKEAEEKNKAANQNRNESEVSRLKNLVTMYESMKAKDAAKIFDRLDMRVLMEVAVQINPRRMSDILAQMTPETAERLTVEFANRAGGEKAPPTAAQLPKIEGKPTN
jgi:flagellar motility protein MotE (MotC chaperone)